MSAVQVDATAVKPPAASLKPPPPPAPASAMDLPAVAAVLKHRLADELTPLAKDGEAGTAIATLAVYAGEAGAQRDSVIALAGCLSLGSSAKSKDGAVRLLGAVGVQREGCAQTMHTICNALADPDPAVRLGMVGSIARLEVYGKPWAPELVKRCLDPDARVRAAVAMTLARLQEVGGRHAEAIMAMLADADDCVRRGEATVMLLKAVITAFPSV
eukprot:SAG22_NODE_7175_length_767_cov_1.351796_1_plen_214_part_01